MTAALPDLIEILPLAAPAAAPITVPGSKSITNRALVLAALAAGVSRLEGALWSEDTQIMVEALRALGFRIEVEADPTDSCNRRIVVAGGGGTILAGGSSAVPLDLFVGNAGTAARFLAPLVCLGRGCYRLHGVARMQERPQQALFDALRELGYRVESPNDRLPALIHGAGPRPGRCRVSIAQSSQFASALLLCAAAGGWEVECLDGNENESPYVEMTRQLITAFPARGGAFQIEPDASSGSYFWAAAWLLASDAAARHSADWVQRALIQVRHWPASGWQIDARFPSFLPLPAVVSRRQDLGDSILTAMVLAPFGGRATRFTDLGRLRVQECERVAAMRTELTRCGARVIEEGDTLRIFPRALNGAAIETYSDHRIAMCFAILGLKVPGMRLKNPACVNKTFPNFFQKLAASPPLGLGAEIVDGRDRRRLEPAELWAG